MSSFETINDPIDYIRHIVVKETWTDDKLRKSYKIGKTVEDNTIFGSSISISSSSSRNTSPVASPSMSPVTIKDVKDMLYISDGDDTFFTVNETLADETIDDQTLVDDTFITDDSMSASVKSASVKSAFIKSTNMNSKNNIEIYYEAISRPYSVPMGKKRIIVYGPAGVGKKKFCNKVTISRYFKKRKKSSTADKVTIFGIIFVNHATVKELKRLKKEFNSFYAGVRYITILNIPANFEDNIKYISDSFDFVGDAILEADLLMEMISTLLYDELFLL